MASETPPEGVRVDRRDLRGPRQSEVSKDNFGSVKVLVGDFAAFRLHAEVLELPGLSSQQREWVHKYARRNNLVSKSTGSSKNRTLLLAFNIDRKAKAFVLGRELATPPPESDPVAAKSGIRTYVPSAGKGGFDDLPSSSQPILDTQGFRLTADQRGLIQRLQKAQPLSSAEEARLSTVDERPHVLLNSFERLPRYQPRLPPKPAKPPNRALPAWGRREELLRIIGSHQVTLVTGETGCGKTTQVPQYLLEEAREAGRAVSLVVTQPRRLPATSVAKRVAAERGERLGSTVGYHIRFDRVYGPETALIFCTSGVLLKTLSDGDGPLENLTHIILDEVHEREQFTDFLLTHLKLSLARFPNLRLILMSATMSEHVELFQRYFSDFGVAVAHIPCRTYHVEEFFLEDVLRLTEYDQSILAEAKQKAREEASRLQDANRSLVPWDAGDEVWDSAPAQPAFARAPVMRPTPIFGPSESGLGGMPDETSGPLGSAGTTDRRRHVKVKGVSKPVSESVSKAFQALSTAASLARDDHRRSPDCVVEEDSGDPSPHASPAPPRDDPSQPFQLTPPGSSTNLSAGPQSWGELVTQPPLVSGFGMAPPPPAQFGAPAGPSGGEGDIYSSMGTWGGPPPMPRNGFSNGYGVPPSQPCRPPQTVTPAEAQALSAAAVGAEKLAELETTHLVELYWDKLRRGSDRVDVHLVVATVKHLASQVAGVGSVLVFLPGMEDMNQIRDRLERENLGGAELQILQLHSQMQDEAVNAQLFSRPTARSLKVILSTNIAEASITLPDVVVVVDTGRVKEKSYAAATETTSLLERWVSRSSAEQRKGRAGRCQNGRVFRLYSRAQFKGFAPAGVPELLRVPIFEACLKARQFLQPHEPIANFLSNAPQPPTKAALIDAVAFLRTLEALDSREGITELGRFLAEVSLGPKAAIALLNALLLRCLDPVLSILAAVSSRDPFTVPFGSEDRDRLKRERMETLRGFYSDHYALFRAVFLYARQVALRPAFGARKAYAFEQGLNFQAMEMILSSKRQIQRDLSRLGLIAQQGPLSWRRLNENSHSWAAVKAALAAGAYPFLAHIDSASEPRRIRTRFEDKAKLLPQSTLAEQLPPPGTSYTYLAYEEVSSRQFGGTCLRTITGLSALTVGLVAGPARLPAAANAAASEAKTKDPLPGHLVHSARLWELGQIRLLVPSQEDASLAWFLRRKWKALVLRKLSDWATVHTADEDRLVSAVVAVLEAEDAAADLDAPPELADYRKNPTIGYQHSRDSGSSYASHSQAVHVGGGGRAYGQPPPSLPPPSEANGNMNWRSRPGPAAPPANVRAQACPEPPPVPAAGRGLRSFQDFMDALPKSATQSGGSQSARPAQGGDGAQGESVQDAVLRQQSRVFTRSGFGRGQGSHSFAAGPNRRNYRP